MTWKYNNSSFIWIFPVGRGSCAFLRTGLNHGFILDMAEGYNDFDISVFIKKYLLPDLTKYPNNEGKKIAQAILSHPHQDHIARCKDLKSGDLYPYLLTCPNELGLNEQFNWKRHGNQKGTEELIETYKSLYKGRNPPLRSIEYDGKSMSHMEYGLYYIRPPVCDKLHEAESAENKYGNSTSIMFYYKHGNQTILFPGDMTPQGMDLVLNERDGAEKRYTKFYFAGATSPKDWHLKSSNQPSLKWLLKKYGLTVLVAPHHGLESCYSKELYESIYADSEYQQHKPQLVCVSERRKTHENDGNTDRRYYGETGATGIHATVNGKKEPSTFLSTKSGLHILLVFPGNAPMRVFANTNPFVLLPEIKIPSSITN